MASSSFSFSISPKLRPCLVRGKKHWFHCWSHVAQLVDASPLRGGHPGGQVSRTVALVEDEQGKVKSVFPGEVQFLDHPQENKKSHEFTSSKCDYYHDGVCWGTKEMNPCSCEGFSSQCNLYPEKGEES